MYEELVAKLRDHNACISIKTLDDAADAIEELSKRVPVPPHGRLIDADALLKDITPTDEDEDNGAKLLMNVFCQVVKTRPTIIPASEGEDA